MNRTRDLLATGAVLLATLALFELTSLDLVVQDRLYDPARGWIVPGDAVGPRVVFYHAPTVLLGVFLAVLAARVVLPEGRGRRVPWSRREAAYLVVSIATVVFTAWLLKNLTGVFGPREIVRYGGEQPYRKLLEALPYVAGRARGDSFPAAHSSGAFALTGLYFVAKTRRARRVGVACGLVLGWTIGLYQMAKGAHYLSHTVVTMILAWGIVQALSRRWVGRDRMPTASAPTAG